MSFIEDVKAKAKSKMKTIVLPEAEDKRTLEAAERASWKQGNCGKGCTKLWI